MKKLILLLLLLTFSTANAEDKLSTFGERVYNWVIDLKGSVVSVDGNTAIIDLGKNANVVKGMKFISQREGKELFSPVTKESLGKKIIETAVLEIKNVRDKYSECIISSKNDIRKGDKIIFKTPLHISIENNLLDEYEITELKYQILKSSNILEDLNQDYKVYCGREKEGDSIAICNFSFKGNTILKSNVSVKGSVITKAGTTTKIHDNNQPFTTTSQEKFTTARYSVATGYLYGKDNGISFAVSDRNKVYIYQIKENKIVQTDTISGFDNIVNIEVIDVNNNNKDELFISHINNKRKVNSQVYEFESNAFNKKQDQLPYLFRTFYIDKKKHIVCQEYIEGAVSGLIYNIKYSDIDGKYLVSNTYDKSYGATIYGFAYGNLYGNKKNTLYINEQGRINLSTDKNKLVYKKEEFGNTANLLIYNEKLDTGINVGDTGGTGGYFVHDERNIAVPIYQRIISTSQGKFLLYSNYAVKKTKKFGIFGAGYIGEYMLAKNEILPAWEKQIQGSTAVVEIDISDDGKYLAYLTAEDWKTFNIGSTLLHIVSIDNL